MIEMLPNALTLPFMQQALLMAAILAVPTALLSAFLILKNWALMGDAISHAVLPGIVIAYIINLPLVLGAFVAGLICTGLTGFIERHSNLRQDTIMGVVFSGMFALGMVLYTRISSDVHLDHILFGDLLGLGWGDLIQTGFIAFVVSVLLIAKRHDLLVASFDESQARVSNLPTGLLHYGLLIMLTLVVVAALKAVGLILAIALLIAPGAIAFLLVHMIGARFSAMLVIAVLVSLIASIGGVLASFYLDSAPAPTIVLVFSLIFFAVYIIGHFREKHGLGRQQ